MIRDEDYETCKKCPYYYRKVDECMVDESTAICKTDPNKSESFPKVALCIIKIMYMWAKDQNVDIGIETDIKNDIVIIHMRTKHGSKRIMKIIDKSILIHTVDRAKVIKQLLDEMLSKLNKDTP